MACPWRPPRSVRRSLCDASASSLGAKKGPWRQGVAHVLVDFVWRLPPGSGAGKR